MKLVIWSLGAVTIVVLMGTWAMFFKAKPLPPIEDIQDLVIVYNETIGDLLPDDYEPKEFKIADAKELKTIRDLIGDIGVSKMPLIDSDDMDEGPNWIINVHFKNGDYRYITVDKNLISDIKIKESPLYVYLKNNYT